MTQTSIDKANLVDYSPAYRVHYPLRGVVCAVYFAQDDGNLSKWQTEYDVFTSGGWGVIKNVPLALGVHGIFDDQELTLRPATFIATATSNEFDTATQGRFPFTDGDQVLVQFVDGDSNQPVITNIFPHSQRGNPDIKNSLAQPNATCPKRTEVLMDGAAGDDGYVFGSGATGSTKVDLGLVVPERMAHHKLNGTHLALDRNGDVFIDFEPHPIDAKGLGDGKVKKKLVVQNQGKDLLRIEKTDAGAVVVLLEGFAGDDITVQIGDGAKHVPIVEALEALWGDLKTALDTFDTHVHPTGVGPSGTPSPTCSCPAWDAGINSTKVSIPNG